MNSSHLYYIFPDTQQIVCDKPSFIGEFVFCPQRFFFFPLARLEKGLSEQAEMFSGGLVGDLVAVGIDRLQGSPTYKIDGPVEPNLFQRGIITGAETLEELDEKINAYIDRSRIPVPFERKDIPHPLRVLRSEIVTMKYLIKDVAPVLQATTKYDTVNFMFARGYYPFVNETISVLGYT